MRKPVHLILALLLFGYLQMGCSREEKAARNLEQIYAEQGVPVRTLLVRPQNFRVVYHYHAVLSGIEESSAYAKIGDKVEKVLVRVGDYVKRDQVLVTFPTDNPGAQYYQARVAYENARTTFQRIQNLFESGGISQQELDNARASFKVAEANWEAVRQMVEVKAPISGYVTSVSVRPSDNVKREAHLVTIAKIHKLKTRVDASEEEIQILKKGQPAMAVWNGDTLQGRVTQVDLAVNPRTQAYGVELEFDNPEKKFLCGLTAEILIEAYSRPNVIVVQRKALQFTSEGVFGFVEVNGKAVRRLLELGRESDLHVEVISGLQPGDHLIVEGHMLLADGTKVNPIQ